MLQTRLRIPAPATLAASAALALVVAMVIALAPNSAEAQSPPGTPSSVNVTRDAGTVTASWPTVSDANKYHITYSSDGKKSWSLAAFGQGSTSITFNATNSKSYVVGVRAGNDHGWSGWRNSAPIGPYVDPAVTPPSAPSAVYVRHKGHIVNFSWNTPSGATSYNVNGSANNKASWTRLASGYSHNKAHIKAKANKTYWIAVQACNSGGCSGWTNSGPATLPKPVSNLRTVTHTEHGYSGGGVRIIWNASNGALSYNLNHSADGKHSWSRIVSNHQETDRQYAVSTRGNDYFAVQPVNGHSTGQWRNTRAAWLTSQLTGTDAATITLTGHTGTWSYKANAGNCASTSQPSVSLTELTGGTTYEYTAYRGNGCSTGNKISSTSFTTPTGASGNITITNVVDHDYINSEIQKSKDGTRTAIANQPASALRLLLHGRHRLAVGMGNHRRCHGVQDRIKDRRQHLG